MSIVTMTQTVGELTSGQTYHVRAKNAELLVAAAQATKSGLKPIAANVPVSKTGKK